MDILNKSDKNIMCSIDECSVNGFMVDPFYATTVNGGKCKFSSVSWSYSQLDENNIEVVEEIEFLFRAYDDDHWLDRDYVNETIILNP